MNSITAALGQKKLKFQSRINTDAGLNLHIHLNRAQAKLISFRKK
jgi:hypothetical protein